MTKARSPGPGERQLGESSKCFAAFNVYLDQGTDRSLRRVAEALGKNEALISRWSSHWQWVARVAAIEDDRVAEREAALRAAELEVRENHLRIGNFVTALVARQLRRYLPAGVEGLPDPAIKPGDLARLLNVAANIEARAVGLGKKVEIAGSLAVEEVDADEGESAHDRLIERLNRMVEVKSQEKAEAHGAALDELMRSQPRP